MPALLLPSSPLRGSAAKAAPASSFFPQVLDGYRTLESLEGKEWAALKVREGVGLKEFDVGLLTPRASRVVRADGRYLSLPCL
jgi:hypothetical protein